MNNKYYAANLENPSTLPQGEGRKTIAYLLNTATNQLHCAGIETPQLDARLLLSHATGLSRAQLVSRANEGLLPENAALFHAFIERRLCHEPVARIIGTKEFWGLEFTLSPATLVPRPDSETLIEAALKLYPDRHKPLKILDIGTGTGCLALALLHEYPNATALALDISSEALATAEINARNLHLSARIEFRVSNIVSALSEAEQFDLIISNPPYIPTLDIETLTTEVRQFDPHLALDGGIDGLDICKKLILLIVKYLANNGTLLLEFGIGQENSIHKICHRMKLTNIVLYADLSGIIRALSATKV